MFSLKSKVDVFVLTALQDEYEAVKQIRPDYSSQWSQLEDSRGNPMLGGLFRAKQHNHAISVLVGRAHGMGELNAAIRTFEVFSDWTFDCLCMCGVCAGNPDKSVAEGDVIVADQVWKMGPGKVVWNYKVNPPEKETKFDVLMEALPPAAWRQKAADVFTAFAQIFDKELRAAYPGPPDSYSFRVRGGPLFTVPDVTIDDLAFRKVEGLKRQTLGLEMEGFAIAAAAKSLGIPKVFLAKGVQDFARPSLNAVDKNDAFREFAASVSAKFCLFFLPHVLTGAPFVGKPDANLHAPPVDILLSSRFNDWVRRGCESVFNGNEALRIKWQVTAPPMSHALPHLARMCPDVFFVRFVAAQDSVFAHRFACSTDRSLWIPFPPTDGIANRVSPIAARIGQLLSASQKQQHYLDYLHQFGIQVL